jgi:hypothetical protein
MAFFVYKTITPTMAVLPIIYLKIKNNILKHLILKQLNYLSISKYNKG